MVRLEDLRKQKWKISNKIEIVRTPTTSIATNEQECHFNVMKEGRVNSSSDIAVDCSYQSWITKLAKCELFLLEYILVNKQNGSILQIAGLLNTKGLTIRRRLKQISDEQRQAYGERMRNTVKKKNLEKN